MLAELMLRAVNQPHTAEGEERNATYRPATTRMK